MKYTLSHKTYPVLSIAIDEGTGTIIELGEMYVPERMPIGVQRSRDAADRRSLNDWWIGRSIPASRSGLREALEALQMASPQLLLTKCCGLSLSDQYWVCPEGSGLRWEDISFFDHPFSDDVGNTLFGAAPAKDRLDMMSPDNTSDGWLKKKWVIADGKRHLIKSGSGATRQEPYNEVLASAIMRRLGIPHIPYTLAMIDGYPYSVCEDFITRDTELISAWHITQTEKKPNNSSLHQHYIKCCTDLGINGAVKAIDQMLTVDYLIVNDDRHLNNFGAIRDANTLEWLGASPVFDCGTSLWCNEPTAMIRPMAKHQSKPFRSAHSEQIKLVSSFDWLDSKALSGIDEEFRWIIADSAFIDEARRDALCNGLRDRAKQLGDYIRSRDLPRDAR